MTTGYRELLAAEPTAADGDPPVRAGGCSVLVSKSSPWSKVIKSQIQPKYERVFAVLIFYMRDNVRLNKELLSMRQLVMSHRAWCTVLVVQ